MAKKPSNVLCQFCQNGHHEHCPNILRGQSIQCPCGCSTNKCNLCKRQDRELDEWGGCFDIAECLQFRQTKYDLSPTVRLIQECRELAASERRDKYESHRQPGTCLCCGQPTSGGKFLPGHNARYKAQQHRSQLEAAK